MMHRGTRAACALALALLTLLVVAPVDGADAADTEEAQPGLEGVPEEIIGRIIDTTSLYATRAFYTGDESAVIAAHVIHQAKEMPWHHGYLRRLQRRMYPAEARATAPTALAEVDTRSDGRLRYRLNLSGAGDAGHGSLTAGGQAATDDFTQGRGSTTGTSLAASAGLRGQRAAADMRASWSLTSLNWRQLDGATSARDRTSIGVGVLARIGAPGRRGKTRISVEGDSYRLGPPSQSAGGDDSIAEARLSAEFDIDRAGRPLTLSVSGVARQTEASDASSVTDTTLASVALADRYAGAALGVVDWRVSAAAYADPPLGSDTQAATQLAAPFELGWTVGSELISVRFHGGYSVQLPPVSLYRDADHVAVNPLLPARTAWNGGASLWARLGPAVLTGSVLGEDATALRVWREEDIPGSDGTAIAWRPAPMDARLLSWRARLAAPRGAHTTFAVSVAGEILDPTLAQAPYRPALTATGEARFDAPAEARVHLTARHVGRRYRSESDSVGMDPYTRFGVRVTRAVTSALDVFAAAEATVGTYQVFESTRDAAWHALSQGGFGVGFTGRI